MRRALSDGLRTMAEVTDLRTRVVKGAFRLMRSPRFVRLLQDKRVLNVIIDGMSVRARSRLLLRDLGTTVARALGLATLEDLRDLERDLRRRPRSSETRAEPPHDPNASAAAARNARRTRSEDHFAQDFAPPEQ